MNLLHDIDEKTVAGILGPLFGSIVAVLRDEAEHPKTRSRVIGEWFSGFATAVFISPALLDWLNLDDRGTHWIAAGGFIMGLVGLKLIPLIIAESAALAKLYFKGKFGEDDNDKKSS